MGSAPINLSDILKPEQINLHLKAQSRDGILKELVGQTSLGEKAQHMLLVNLKQREELGSTGIGKGVAIPHCRSLLLNSLSLIVGRSKNGVDFDAIDRKTSRLFFLIIAPPHDPQNQYLIVLGKIAQLAKGLTSNDSLFTADTPEEFIFRMDELEKKL
ncbi:PTS sugar transporter subunit IIA [candidate division TA06 bacterium]|uniref:PTS sugar transporter subunit IIA n=1 Tax=candidate division TA06 bacterium TaxID=2250710 RepID=A0A933I990_UNCT6|nr:PTS sugar transporter subunit IIA [candidate division TA06 bacterium]